MGVAILPHSDATGPGAEVVALPLTGPSLSRDITLAWREGRRHPPAVARFLELCRDLFAIDTGLD
jgi:DNA-binding transcriptional LysR family regulator